MCYASAPFLPIEHTVVCLQIMGVPTPQQRYSGIPPRKLVDVVQVLELRPAALAVDRVGIVSLGTADRAGLRRDDRL